MPNNYPPEFRRQMVELVRAGRTPEELAKEFQPSAQSIRTWVRQADLDDGRRQAFFQESGFPLEASGAFLRRGRGPSEHARHGIRPPPAPEPSRLSAR